VGEFELNQKKFGKYYFEGKDTTTYYEGYYENNRPLKGTVVYPDKVIEEPEFDLNGNIVRGVSKYKNGDRYEGPYLDDMREGVGKYYCAKTGDVYHGEFHRNQRHGQGTLLSENKKFRVVMREGEYVSIEEEE
jgi:hypothetical protein